jgi:AcrR family transcriptional regulator
MAQKKQHAGKARGARRKRDPVGTREAILEAAREVLAQDGKEGLSVARVAQRAGVNRGTA